MDKLKPGVYKDEDWRLFIESSKRSLKAILLHETNAYAWITIAYLTKHKEVYSRMKIISEKSSANNINEKFVEILQFFQIFWDSNQEIRSILASCAYGTAGILIIITKENFGRKKMCLERESRNVNDDPLV